MALLLIARLRASGYTGKEVDEATGLLDFGARYRRDLQLKPRVEALLAATIGDSVDR